MGCICPKNESGDLTDSQNLKAEKTLQNKTDGKL